MSAMMRTTMLTFTLVATTGSAAETPSPPEGETTRLSPSIRPVPLPRSLRFEPRPDISTSELDALGPYLKGKPLYDEDRKALGSAMRHLSEVK